MFEIKGKNNTAKVFTDKVEDGARAQIEKLLDMEIFKDSKIRIMPDVHSGTGCTIGTTMTIKDYVIPNIVGVDIGCGMKVAKIKEKEIDLARLDEVIRENIPSGRDVHEGRIVHFPQLQELKCYRNLKDSRRLERSIGTLGGGNHFIEADTDEDGNIYLVIHSGSRNLGTQVAEYYQHLAYEILKGKDKYFEEYDRVIVEYKAQGRKKEIQAKLKELLKEYEQNEIDIPEELAYLSGKYFNMYIHDMKICQEFATANRNTMMDIIVNKMNLTIVEEFTTIHNYLEFLNDSITLRKGAVRANLGEKLIIPINMKDGSLIAIGKGNPDWNYSAPHGAGRLFSRSVAKEKITLEEYQESMKGIFSTSVNTNTIDESPFAYKPIEEIIQNTKDTIDIKAIIKPIYNFKASN